MSDAGFRAFRHARLLGDVFSAGGVSELVAARFGALQWPEVTFEVRAQAVCQRAPHAAPHPDCSCGLYALKDFAAINARDYSGFSDVLNQVLLEVVVHGDVFEGERGFRSQFQTVVAVSVPDRCVLCYRGRVCRLVSPVWETSTGTSSNLPLFPACEVDHPLLGGARFVEFSLEDVSHLLGRVIVPSTTVVAPGAKLPSAHPYRLISRWRRLRPR